MGSDNRFIVTVNAGSSSLKLAAFTAQNAMQKVFEAAVDAIGQQSAKLITPGGTQTVDAKSHTVAAGLLMRALVSHVGPASISAVGHRIVHGGPEYQEPQIASGDVLTGLQKFVPLDPQHLLVELQLVEALKSALPHAVHVLCFDTAFHHDLPRRAQLLPLPRHFAGEVRRYGFHGLSYAYILEELRRVEGEAAANGRVVIAHLGSGVSLAAIHNGKPIDTTMSMTPASGLPMSTRSGDLDPGLALYFEQTHSYDTKRFNHMVNFESGLLGMSGKTADMETLLELEASDDGAKDAVDVFCYQVKKSIGSLAAALGGLNTLVFTGGMGENAPKIRARVCQGLEFLGIHIDHARNQEAARLLSAEGSPVGVHVIHTDEAVTIARETARLAADKEGRHAPH